MRSIHKRSNASLFFVMIVVILPSLASCEDVVVGPFHWEARNRTVNLTGTVTAANDGTPLSGVTVQHVGLETSVVPGHPCGSP